MTPEEIKATELAKETALIEKMKSEMISKFNDLIAGSTEFKGLKDLVEKVDAAKTATDLKALTGQIEEIGLKVVALAEQGAKGKKAQFKTYADVVVDRFKKAFTDGDFKKLANAKTGSITLDLKAAETMSETTSIVAIGAGPAFSLTEYEQGVTNVVRRKPFLLQLVNSSRTIMEFLAWAEQTVISPGNAGNTAEGAAKTQGSFRWTEKTSAVETMTYYVKATKRILDDIAVMENEIRMEIMTLLALKLDFNILKGSGVSPALKGILNHSIQTVASSNNFGALAGLIKTPGNVDVLRAAINTIETNGAATSVDAGAEVAGIFTPNYIVLHPSDVAIMELTKDGEGRYLLPPFIQDGYTKVAGVPVISNIGMTAGSFLVGDFTKSNVRLREDASIAVGFENDDFTKNLVTILGELRAGHYIKSNHLNAFMSDTFDNGITALGPGKP